jgi:broad specificity phosphatase PhoE
MSSQAVLESLTALPATSHAAAMIRHGERQPFNSATDPTKALLTDEGKRAARALGAGLSGFDRVRLFHSPVERCRQTAECIAEGAAAKGLSVSIAGPSDALGFGYTRDMPKAIQMYSAMDHGFIDHWFSGRVPDSVIADPSLLVEETLAHITRHLGESDGPGRRLDLHVSHDWNILAMRELLLGITHEQSGWLTFLDGLGFSRPSSGPLQARYHACERHSPLPWRDYHRRASKPTP